jgi:hypothetical protein
MSGSFRLHNKFHRSSHYSLSSASVQEHGIDPIASKEEPFNGVFYNILTDQNRTYNISTNSYDWYSNYTTLKELSSKWDLAGTTYTTVRSNSSNWNNSYSAYSTLCAVSANYNSTYTTVRANSASWANEYVLYTNRVQENTKSKTFRGYTLSVNNDNTVDWNLDIAQVAYLTLYSDVTIKNPPPSSMKSGGIYNLYVIQGNPDGDFNITFGSNYVFPLGVDISSSINFELSGVTIFNFFSDSIYMHGDFYKTDIPENGEGIVRFGNNKNMKIFGSPVLLFPFASP